MSEPFNLAAWRAQRTQQLALPSGLVVTVHKAGLLDLAAQGSIPTPLADTVQAMLSEAESMERVMLDLANFARYASVINIVVKAAVIDPPIADEPDATHVGITEIPMLDRLEIFNWAQQEGAALISFPDESAGDPPVARGRKRLSDAPVRAAGDR